MSNRTERILKKGTLLDGHELTADVTEIVENGMTFYVDSQGRKWPSPKILGTLIKENLAPGGVFVNPKTGERVKREDL